MRSSCLWSSPMSDQFRANRVVSDQAIENTDSVALVRAEQDAIVLA